MFKFRFLRKLSACLELVFEMEGEPPTVFLLLCFLHNRKVCKFLLCGSYPNCQKYFCNVYLDSVMVDEIVYESCQAFINHWEKSSHSITLTKRVNPSNRDRQRDFYYGWLIGISSLFKPNREGELEIGSEFGGLNQDTSTLKMKNRAWAVLSGLRISREKK